jgi:hypothetical protein
MILVARGYDDRDGICDNDENDEAANENRDEADNATYNNGLW